MNRRAVLVMLGVAVLAGCRREERAFRIAPPANARAADGLRLTQLQPGQPTPHEPAKNAFEDNAQAMSDGQRLYSAFNCVGCHAHGGGGMGPPLMDEKWRYGSDPEQVFATIMQGRPNGMPSFRGKVSEQQAWKLVGYVRSLSGLTPMNAAPGRDDHMQGSPPPNSVERAEPTGEKAPSP